MTGERWKRASVAADALAWPEQERAAFVTSRCDGDESLSQDVDSLLASTIKAADLFETPILTASGVHAVLSEAEARIAAAGCRLPRSWSTP